MGKINFGINGAVVSVNGKEYMKGDLRPTLVNDGYYFAAGDPLQLVQNWVPYYNAIDSATGLPFASLAAFTTWITDNVYVPGEGGAPATVEDGSITEPKLSTALAAKINGKADESEVILIGGQAPSGPLVFGTTNEQGVNMLVNGNPHMIVTNIGNFGFNVGSAPEVPFLVGGGIWTQAGAVWGQMSPYSGTDLTIGTTTNHPVNLQANNSTILTLNTDGSITSTGALQMGSNKVVDIAAGTDPTDAVNFQQLGTKADASALNAKVNKAGDTMSGGLSFGSVAVASAQDVSRHIALYSTDWGINITSETMNFNAANDGSSTTKYAFYHGANPLAYIEDGIIDAKALITKEYFEANKKAAHVAGADPTSLATLASSIDAIRDAMVTAGLMDAA